MLLAGEGSTGPSIDALPVLPQLGHGASQKTPLAELEEESAGQIGRTWISPFPESHDSPRVTGPDCGWVMVLGCPSGQSTALGALHGSPGPAGQPWPHPRNLGGQHGPQQ